VIVPQPVQDALAEGKIAAALFDFDGTLVDTMPLHFAAYRRVLADTGIELTPEDFYNNIGGNARETIPKFLRGRPCSLDIAEIHARKKQIVSGYLASGEVPVLEAAGLLAALHDQLTLGLVSTGSRPGIETVLDRFDWRRYFQAIITGEDAPRGKPAPDLYLLAAARLEVPAEACIVFEDTAAGLEAAARAGMRGFDVRNLWAPFAEGAGR
jgi:HAD superfamily hydrolase (TIGR01509 family)